MKLIEKFLSVGGRDEAGYVFFFYFLKIWDLGFSEWFLITLVEPCFHQAYDMETVSSNFSRDMSFAVMVCRC